MSANVSANLLIPDPYKPRKPKRAPTPTVAFGAILDAVLAREPDADATTVSQLLGAACPSADRQMPLLRGVEIDLPELRAALHGKWKIEAQGLGKRLRTVAALCRVAESLPPTEAEKAS